MRNPSLATHTFIPLVSPLDLPPEGASAIATELRKLLADVITLYVKTK